MLLPSQSDHHAQAVFGREVKQPNRRHRVGAHDVDAGSRHRTEVHCDRIGSSVLAVFGGRSEGAVGDAVHDHRGLAYEERLAFRAYGGRLQESRIVGEEVPTRFGPQWCRERDQERKGQIWRSSLDSTNPVVVANTRGCTVSG